MQGAAADAEFLRRRGDVSIRGCERLHDESPLRRVQIERARLFLKRRGARNARGQRRPDRAQCGERGRRR